MTETGEESEILSIKADQIDESEMHKASNSE
jgi:hypothetical protein